MVRIFLFLVLCSNGFCGSLEGLRYQYDLHCMQSSDINEHIPTLRELASQCETVTEIGVGHVISTWGILQGLSESSFKNVAYRGIDLNYPSLERIYLAASLAKKNEIMFNFLQANDFLIDLEPTDMLFIDSWHTYRHLTYELETFSPKVSKYIAMHDTSPPWGYQDEPFYQGFIPEYPAHINLEKRGLWPAVEDFLSNHPEWVLKKRYLNNCGFTILERVKR
jgi:hypothetical protein